MDFTLHGRNALVCGASQGIGRACALELAEQGANVTALARDESALKSLVGELMTKGDQRHGFIAADFTKPKELVDKVADYASRIGTIHILVNNTGGPPSGPLLDATTDDLLSGLSNHVLCFQRLVQVAVPAMKEAKFGRIINIISTSVLMPIRGLGVSNTTRGAVANWGRTLAGELAPFGITVNNVLPGFTGTDRLTSLLTKKAGKLGKSLQQVEEDSKSTIPAGRFADPHEIGAVVAFLASPAASYVNGVNLPVDGGRTAVQ